MSILRFLHSHRPFSFTVNTCTGYNITAFLGETLNTNFLASTELDILAQDISTQQNRRRENSAKNKLGGT